MNQRRQWLPFAIIISAVSTIGMALQAADTGETSPVTERLEKKMADVRSDFPDVRHLSPDETDELIAPVFIDVRKSREYAVSRLPGAVHAPDEATLLAAAKAAGDRPIVVYCSLGVRSSNAVRLLNARGMESAVNLDGSIFRWANEGRPLENDAGATDKAHPFNAWWGRYLEARLHARKPQ
ncbi:MAG: rhodanese-like domain-containing protein [Pseudomonadota bacterium]